MSTNVYNPAAVVKDEQVVLLFRAHAADKVSRIGIAVSNDGLHFDAEPSPVIEPTEPFESRGCEDPRITQIDGTFYLTYTGYDGTSALLCLATSTDLHTWHKHGPLFPDLDTWQSVPWMIEHRGHRPWNKAGGIVPVAIDGLWHMYVGEGAIYHATSKDLLNWEVVAAPLLEPRQGCWDADLVEVGAPPVIAGDSLVLLINGARISSIEGLVVDYRCGQVAFSARDPRLLMTRSDDPWLEPTTVDEKTGLVPNVTFVEGLVNFRGRWLAYFGQSDTTTAVAVSG